VVVAGFCQGASPAAQTIGYQEEVSPTIKGAPSGTAQVPAVFSFDSLSSNSMKSSNPQSGCRQVEVSKCIDTTNPDPSKNQGGMAVVQPVIAFTQNQREEVRDLGDKAGSIAAESGMHQQTYVAEVYDARGNGDGSIVPTMTGDHQNRVTDYTGIVSYTATQFANYQEGVGTLRANGGDLGGWSESLVASQSVRRLTPLECERLQGFPDNWTNIPPQTDVTEEDLTFWRTVWDEWDDMNGKKRHSDKQIVKWLKSEPADSARYKALGNSIALPPWRFVLSRIRAQGAVTMGSLFDGISGFVSIWAESGGITKWTSEIEPFPIAVTRYHFKEAHNGK
jgi:DNA (cytosine-5)-methyltransferase 1